MTLLMMSTWLLETCRELEINKYKKKNCASSWLFTKTNVLMLFKGKVLRAVQKNTKRLCESRRIYCVKPGGTK